MLSVRFVVDRDAMAEHHLAAFPSGEQHDEHRNEGERDAERHDGAGAVAIAFIEAEQLYQHHDDIADRMLPYIAESAYARVTEEIDEPGDGSQGGPDDAGTEEPKCPRCKHVLAGQPKDDVEQKGCDEKSNRKRDQ